MTALASPALSPRQLTRGHAVLALLLIVPIALIGESAAIWLYPGTALGIGAYWLGKVCLVLFPAIWLRYVERRPFSWSPPRNGGLGVGVLTGLLIVGVMVTAYAIARAIPGVIPVEKIKPMMGRNYLNIWWVYLGFAVLISSGNALMEEYVWRWFVFRQTERVVPAWNGWLAMVLANLFFTIHHTCAMRQFDHAWVVTVQGSLGVFLGGVIWSMLYRRYGSIWPGFVCHIFADLAMFGIGGHLIFFS